MVDARERNDRLWTSSLVLVDSFLVFVSYVIIYIFSRCIWVHTIIDRSSLTDERDWTLLFSIYSCVLLSSSSSWLSLSSVVHYKYQSFNATTTYLPIQSHCLALPANEKKAKRQRGRRQKNTQEIQKTSRGREWDALNTDVYGLNIKNKYEGVQMKWREMKRNEMKTSTHWTELG